MRSPKLIGTSLSSKPTSELEIESESLKSEFDYNQIQTPLILMALRSIG